MISVLMPVYNSQSFLEEAIESVLNQTYKNFEFLIYDDNSIDSSKKIIIKFSQKDSRIKFFFSKKNLGHTALLNMMIDKSKFNFLARMDSDDISVKTRFKKQLNFLLNNPKISAVGSFAEIIDDNGNFIKKIKLPVYDKEIKEKLLNDSVLMHPTVMLRKDFIKQINAYRECAPAEDYDLWTRLSLISSLHNLPEYLLKYRIHSKSVSSLKRDYQFLYGQIVKKNYENLLLGNPDIIENFHFKNSTKSQLMKKFYFLKKKYDDYQDFNFLLKLIKKKNYMLFIINFICLFFKKPVFLITKILVYIKKKFN